MNSNTFMGWFYECPEKWADADVVGRFSESCRAYSEYIGQLQGKFGNALQTLAMEWVLGERSAVFRGAEVVDVSLRLRNLERTEASLLSLMLSCRDGSTVVARYESPSGLQVPSFCDLMGWEQPVDGHELLVDDQSGQEQVIHMIYFAGYSHWRIKARDVKIDFANANARAWQLGRGGAKRESPGPQGAQGQV